LLNSRQFEFMLGLGFYVFGIGVLGSTMCCRCAGEGGL